MTTGLGFNSPAAYLSRFRRLNRDIFLSMVCQIARIRVARTTLGGQIVPRDQLLEIDPNHRKPVTFVIFDYHSWVTKIHRVGVGDRGCLGVTVNRFLTVEGWHGVKGAQAQHRAPSPIP